MKNLYFAIVLVFTLLAPNSYAQTSGVDTVWQPTYQKDHGWYLGLNIGSTYQRSDIHDRYGLGGGFILGKNITPKHGRSMYLDLRFRGLWGITHGQDFTRDYTLDDNLVFNGGRDSTLTLYKDSVGYTYNNYRMKLSELSLEAALNFNSLRERTGIIFYVFGGVGLTKWETKTDQLDDAGNIYDYSGIDTTQSNIDIVRDIYDLRNTLWTLEDYETLSEGSEDPKYQFMPSLGVGLGYQITPGFSIGLEHKMTFARNDYTDGVVGENPKKWYGDNDVYHYTGLGLRWRLGNDREPVGPTGPVGGGGGVVGVPPPNGGGGTGGTGGGGTGGFTGTPPTVNITSPATCPITVYDNLYNFRAFVRNVAGQSDVTFKQNGANNNSFNYNANTDVLTGNVVLQPGNNVFEVTGTNNYGTATKTCVIRYEQPVNNCPPPIVDINNPPGNTLTVTSPIFNVKASIQNVNNSSDLTYTVNGVTSGNFSFNPNTFLFTSNITLAPGSNTVTIRANTNCGSDTETATIILNTGEVNPPPIVTITNPPVCPKTVNAANFNVKANIMHVSGANNVTFRVNGILTQNFSYNSATDQFNANITLVQGNNTITIKGTNSVGSDTKTCTIIYNPINTTPPPVVNFTSPANNHTTNNATINVTGTVLNVNSQNDVKVRLNGVLTQNFTYNVNTKVFNIPNMPLNVGNNTVQVTGTNSVGSDTETLNIIRREVTGPPPVVTFTNPPTTPTTVMAANYTVTAKVLNVSSKSDITVNVNGNNTQNFSFNTGTLTVTLPLVLNTGTNTITITGTNQWGSDTKTTVIIRKKPQTTGPPPIVTITNPASSPHTTNAPAFTVKGNVLHIAAKSDMTVKVNGVITQNFTYNPQTKAFVIPLTLNEGNNVVQVTGTNTFGSDTKGATIIYTRPIETGPPPVVTYTAPAVSPRAVTNPNTTVKATVINVSSKNQITVQVNGNATSNFTFNTGTKEVTLPLTLAEGTTTITTTGTNQWGSDTKSTVLTYTKPTGPPPVVTYINPAQNPKSVQSATYQVKAKVLNVVSKNDIEVRLNNQVITNFTFALGSKEVGFMANLNVGNNTVRITGTNQWGTDTESTVIKYEKQERPCEKPVVSFTSPGTNPFETTSTQVVVKGKVTNVPNKNNVKVKVNGLATNNFTYNAVTDEFTITFNMLREGLNSFEVRGTNTCGSDVATMQVSMRPPLPSPDIDFRNPPTQPFATDKATMSINGEVRWINSKSDMTVVYNGQTVTNFTYNLSSKTFLIPVTLNTGSNSVTITATNASGSTTQTRTMVLNTQTSGGLGNSGGTGGGSGGELNAPVISFTTPPTTPFNSPVASGNVKGVVSNITQQSQLVVKFNGSVVTNYVFSPATRQFSIPVSLNTGPNFVEITATNNIGSVTKSVSLIYNATTNSGSNNGGGSGGNTQVGNNTGGGTSPAPKATISPMSPSSGVATTTNASYTVKARIGNVSSKSAITVRVNGASRPFSYSTSSKIVSVNAQLRVGKNTVVITAGKGSSAASRTITITRKSAPKPVVQKPSITMTAPTGNTSTTSTSYSIKAKIKNATKSQVTVKVNGSTRSFSLSGGNLVCMAPLKPGKNTIVITAGTGSNRVSKTITITKNAATRPGGTGTKPKGSTTTTTKTGRGG